MRQLSVSKIKEKCLSKAGGIYSNFPRKSTQVCIAILLAAVLTALGMRLIATSYTYVVYLDDEEIGYVQDGQEIMDFMVSLKMSRSELTGLEVQAVQEVRVEKERRWGIKPDDVSVRDYLLNRLKFDTYGYLITVNDNPTLAVPTLSEYEQVLENLKLAYLSGSENTVVQEIVLHGKVEAQWDVVDPDSVYSADKAAEILRRGTDTRQTYLVSRGDTIWGIARANNIAEDQIRSANPQLQNSDRLQIGQELELVVAEPLVHVLVTEDITVTEKIPFQTIYQNDAGIYSGATRVLTSGSQGKKEVTYRISRENEKEVERKILKETVLEEPRTQVVARGTKAAPVAGSGRFIWPIKSGGRITSRFGPRWGSIHYGVDIGAPLGTPIAAADSGVVVFSGRAGSYGNLITIDHGNGYSTRYAHNSVNVVSVGQRVQKGAQIANVGSTGYSTGPHVHFEIRRNGAPVNPLDFF
ncbi:MAG: peptidoglycan DD-metalloendopeptidase family protein [Dethiobacter sp.]|jgi:murein DD-endopeptidase MepM/ murein hydrolase activator NlpD|nr:peptidoglycan DD-metalloendopeptidase family protein [Dethiobacter sp.]